MVPTFFVGCCLSFKTISLTQQLAGAPQFGLNTEAGAPNASQNEWLLGLVNGAPYLACCVIGCWLTSPLNKYLGRRGAIFVTAFLSAITCIWSACTNSWGHLFAARFVLGLGIGVPDPLIALQKEKADVHSLPGPKSATVPVYAAETAPPLIRGALVMVRLAESARRAFLWGSFKRPSFNERAERHFLRS